jgi:hypothetical protein
VGLVFFFMRLLKKVKPDQIPMELLQPRKSPEEEEATAEITADLLNQMIRQKPESVGAALRTWMVAPKNN